MPLPSKALKSVLLRNRDIPRYDPCVIPAIGMMIGFYVLTRMVQVLGTKGENVVTCTFAGFTILVTLLCLFVLLTSGMSASSLSY